MKIFGIQWNHQRDVLQIKGMDTCDCTVMPAKREVLKTVAKIFDPLGLITPVTFQGKGFLQELWKKGVTWDEPLSSELAKKWCDIVQGLSSISAQKKPCYVSCIGDNLDCCLFVFCDASIIKAYATAIYLRIQNQDSVQVNLIFSKMKLASKGLGAKKKTKEITLPRLELLAMTIRVRAANFVMKQLQGSIPDLKRMLLTDSACVLYWLKTSKPLSIFVEKKVKEIKQEKILCVIILPILIRIQLIFLCTRGMNVSEISQSKLWWNGPEWVRRPQILWPKWNIPSVNLETEMEVKGPTVLYETNMVTNHDRPFNSAICGIDHHKYSSLRKLLRITVYCLSKEFG